MRHGPVDWEDGSSYLHHMDALRLTRVTVGVHKEETREVLYSGTTMLKHPLLSTIPIILALGGVPSTASSFRVAQSRLKHKAGYRQVFHATDEARHEIKTLDRHANKYDIVALWTITLHTHLIQSRAGPRAQSVRKRSYLGVSKLCATADQSHALP